MTEVQLPPRFQPHPEVAAGAITVDQAAMMIQNGWLTYEGACFLLPPRAWGLLPKPVKAKPRQRKWWRLLKFWRLR